MSVPMPTEAQTLTELWQAHRQAVAEIDQFELDHADDLSIETPEYNHAWARRFEARDLIADKPTDSIADLRLKLAPALYELDEEKADPEVYIHSCLAVVRAVEELFRKGVLA